MPKLSCPCGFIHDLSPIPDNGWRTIRDCDYEDLIADELQLKVADVNEEGMLIRSINDATGLLYLCPKCGRIMWRKENQKKFIVYVPEISEE